MWLSSSFSVLRRSKGTPTVKNLGRLLVLFAALGIASFSLGCNGGPGDTDTEVPSGIPDEVEDPALADDASADAPVEESAEGAAKKE